jgi:hypothetical protein
MKVIKIHRYIILSVVLYGCETCRLGMFENRALRRIFEARRDEITGEWGKLHN